MRIARINRVEWAETVAFIDIKTYDDKIIKVFRLVNCSNRMSLAAPDEKAKMGSVTIMSSCQKDLKQNLKNLQMRNTTSNKFLFN